MLDLEYAQLSDPGKVRDHNEDYYGCYVPASPAQIHSHGWLFALADGVGGHDHGEVASRTAVDKLVAGFAQAPAGELHSTLLPKLIQAANTEIIETGMSMAGTGRSRMATTLVACALRFDRAQVAHVGDSRCYFIRGGKAAQVTRDHTFVNEQVKLGLLSAKEAAASTGRNVLSRSLGNELFVNVDTSEHSIVAGDVLAMCSDGLHGSVSGEDIANAIATCPDLDTAARSLVDLAKHRDGGDNITLQLIRVRAVERVGMYRGRPYKLR